MKRHLILGILFFTSIVLFSGAAKAAPPNPLPNPPQNVNIANQPIQVEGEITGTVSMEEPVEVTVVNPNDGPVATADVFEPGRMPERFGPVVFNRGADDPIPGGGYEVVPPVTSGWTFILTHLHGRLYSNISGVPLVTGNCNVFMTVTENGGTTYIPSLYIPLEQAGSGFFGTLETFLPLNAGEGINVLCLGSPEGPQDIAQGFRATAGGYFVPAP